LITVARAISQRILLSLNSERAKNDDTVSVVFESPSRPTLTFTKSLTNYGQGFFYFDLAASEGDQLIDSTYAYRIERLGEILKIGNVRIIEGEEFGLDNELEFLLA